MGLKETLSGLAQKIVSVVYRLVDVMMDSLNKIFEILGLDFPANMESLLPFILAFLIIAALTSYFIKLLGKWIYNSLAGIALLFLLRYFLGIMVPINLFTVLAALLFGVPGLIAILVLWYGGGFQAL